MSQAKERPILFSGPMIRALLDGRKTVTRRAVKVQPRSKADIGSYGPGQPFIRHPDPTKRNPECPYGRPGDRLWVRESFWQAGNYVQSYPDDDEGSWAGSRRVHYRADGAPPNEPNRHYPSGLHNGSYSAAEPDKIWRPRPSIHMPRWASRILLEITDVRVERLQEISEQQAKAEGIIPHVRGGWHWHPHNVHDMDDWHQFGFKTAYWAFHDLWIGINGAESWNVNPWVWVVEFKRIQP